jgi:hypothetical protein
MNYNCAWCGDISDKVLEVINEQNACDLCIDLARRTSNE